MLFSLSSVVTGGFTGIIQTSFQHGKDLSFWNNPKYWSPDLFESATVWGLLLGYFFMELASQGTDQLTVQRFLTTASAKDSAKSLWCYAWLALPVSIILWLLAMGLFAFYTQNPSALDPAVKPNTLLSYYIVTQVPHGVAGVFMAAIMAAVLSTVDAGLNCLATATLTDIHLRFSKHTHSESRKVILARLWTAFWTIITVLLAVFVLITAKENMVRTGIEIFGLFSGVLLGIFLLGVLTKRANVPGVWIGTVLGFAVVIYCNYFWVRLRPDGTYAHISFSWPCAIGTIATFTSGYVASFFFPPPPADKIIGLTCNTFNNESTMEIPENEPVLD